MDIEHLIPCQIGVAADSDVRIGKHVQHPVVSAHGNVPVGQRIVVVKVVNDLGLRVNDVAEDSPLWPLVTSNADNCLGG